MRDVTNLFRLFKNGSAGKSITACLVATLLALSPIWPSAAVIAAENEDAQDDTAIVATAEGDFEVTVAPAETEAEAEPELSEELVVEEPETDVVPDESSDTTDSQAPPVETDTVSETEVSGELETSETDVEATEPVNETEPVVETPETTEATEPDVQVDEYIVFDQYFTVIDESLVQTPDLMVQTGDASVFTYNTNVVSNYDDVYILSFSSVEEARYAYSYYVDKVDTICDLSSVVSIATGDDTADLSDLNNGSDAISNLNDITIADYSGYIALIDTGASADANYSVIGSDTADYNGHGSDMYGYILEENPDAKVVSIKVTDGKSANAADIYAGFKLAIEMHVSVINFSMTGYDIEKNQIIKDVINEAIASGIVVIGAAGNSNADANKYIAGCIEGATVVGAVNSDGTKTLFSNYNADLYVVADSTSEAAARYTGIYTAGVDSDKVFAQFKTEGGKEIAPASDIELSDEEQDFLDWLNTECSEGGYWIVSVNEFGDTYYEFVSTDFTTAVSSDNGYNWLGDSLDLIGMGLSEGSSGTDSGTCYVSDPNHDGWGTVSGINSTSGSAIKLSDFCSSFDAVCARHFGEEVNHHAAALSGDCYYEASYTVVSDGDSKLKIQWTVHLSSRDDISSPSWHDEELKVRWRVEVSLNTGSNSNVLPYKISAAYSTNGGSSWTYISGNGTDRYSYIPSSGAKQIVANLSSALRSVIQGVADGAADEFGGIRYLSGPSGKILDPTDWALIDGAHTEFGDMTWTWQATNDNQVYMGVLEGTGPKTVKIGLTKKTYDNMTAVTSGNACYSLDGTVYTLYSDAACTNAVHTFTFNANGNTDVFETESFPSTWYLKETVAGPGYKLDSTVYTVSIGADRNVSISGGSATANNSGTTKEIIVYDTPIVDPFFIQLQKVNNINNSSSEVPMDSVTFHVCFYAADYGITAALPGTPTDDFYITYSNPAAVKEIGLPQLTGHDSTVTVTGNNDYLTNLYNSVPDDIKDELPLGTYTIQESTAPTGYLVNPTVYRIRLYEVDDHAAREIRNMTTGETLTAIISGNEITAQFNSIYESHEIAWYSLTKTIPDTTIRQNLAGFEYKMYWKKSDGSYVLFATGYSQSDGRVYWTYNMANYYHLEDDGKTRTLLTNTKTYKLELVAGENYEVRETVVNLPYGNGTDLYYNMLTPAGWSKSSDGSYVYTSVKLNNAETISSTQGNDWDYNGGFTLKKVKPTNDIIDLTKVTFTVYTYVNSNKVVIATGTTDANGNITWTRTATNGWGVVESGNYNRKTSINTIVDLPLGTYYIEEAWDKVYIDTNDLNVDEIEVFATNNTSGWTTDATGSKYVCTYTANFTTDTPTVTNLTNVENELHYQWFSANKVVTVAGDASTVEFELWYTSGSTPVLFATGYADTNGVGTYPIIWDGYNGPAEYIQNAGQKIVLPEGSWEIREIHPETYYQNGEDNVPYTYMVPTGWSDHIGANGHTDYFYKTFTAGNDEDVVINSINPTNTRIEAELTISKIEQTNSSNRQFRFAIYYRGNEAQAENIGNFDDMYLLDIVTVDTTNGSGFTTLTKIPEGWYEIVEIDNDGWKAVWFNNSTNTAAGKLVHADSQNKAVAQIVIQDNVTLLGRNLDGVLCINEISPTVQVNKLDAWTGAAIASAADHPAGVHLEFFLYEDRNLNGVLDDTDLYYGYISRIDGTDKGYVKFEELKAGIYIVREVATVNGYYLTAADSAAFTLSDPTLTVIGMSNKPYTETVKVNKVDNETNEPLSGAEFKVFVDSNDNGVYDSTDAVAEMWNDANGNNIADAGELMPAVLVETSKGVYESYELHFNDGSAEFGNRYFVVETQAPENYFFVNDDGTFSTESVVKTVVIAKKDTTAVDFQVGSSEFDYRNQTGTVFAKKTNQDGKFLSGAEFTVYKDQACTQKVGILTEDTANEIYSYKGLSLGTWYLKETKAPTGFEVDPNVYAFEITLDEVHPVVVNFMSYKYNIDGAFVDVELRTTSFDPELTDLNGSYTHIVRDTVSTDITDRVYFDGLVIGETYEVTGDLVYKTDTADHKAGDVIKSVTVTFVAGDDTDANQTYTVNADGTTIEGYYDVEFTVDTTKITTEFVAFETVKNLTTGEIVGIHMDLTDEAQTKVIPKIGTTATDDQTKIDLAAYGDKTVFVDTVSFENLVKGETYTVEGSFIDKETQQEVSTGSTTFTADGTVTKTVTVNGITVELVSGSVDVEFTVDTTKLAGHDLVAYEYLYTTGINGTDVLVSSHEDIDDEGQTIHVPDMKTHANVPDEDIRIAPAVEDYEFTDTVYYENLIPGKTYVVTGTIYFADTGKQVLDKNGLPYVGETAFTPEQATGSVDVKFVIDTSVLQGKSLVVFEDMYYNNIKIATHADLTDKEQSFDIPELHTDASTALNNIVEYSTEAVITDRVYYSNLVAGKTYTVTGTLTVKSTGESVLDKNGNVATATTTFTADKTEGYVDVTFVFDSTLYEGEVLVAYETLTYKNIVYAVHADINDEDQTTYVPEVKTTATTAIGKVAEYTQTAKVTDRVYYYNLEPGVLYEVKGTLMVKSTGLAAKDINGNDVTAATTFTPETSEGYVDLTFEFDATLYKGDAVVVFETLYYNDIVYAVHADINDEGQTVYVPVIGTTATDANGNKTFQATATATIVDEISYKNLEVGKTYLAEGVLMDKSTGAPLLIDGQEVRASATFVPEATEGTATVTFSFNASALANKSLVVFETVYAVTTTATVDETTGETVTTETKTIVATHEDINDEGQTVTITDIPKTGDNSGFNGFAAKAGIAALVAAVAGAGVFLLLKKKNWFTSET